MKVAILVARELVCHVYLADELSVRILGHGGPKALENMAMRASRHGVHLDYFLSLSILLVKPNHFHVRFINILRLPPFIPGAVVRDRYIISF